MTQYDTRLIEMLFSLPGMTTCRYTPLLSATVSELFPDPIYLNEVPLLSLLGHKALLDYVTLCVLKYQLVDSPSAPTSPHSKKGASKESMLEKLGNVTQITEALARLHHS